MCELFCLSSQRPTRATFSLRRFAAHGAPDTRNVDGWGVAFYDGREAWIYKEPEPAAHSPWLTFIEQQSRPTRLLISHIRRATRGAKGPNWLFFGDQRKDHDFLYADEWAEYQKSGVLTRLDTAFSRDQVAKVYVQDRMRESAVELWKWIQQGAYFYVCGDAKRMAKDVDAALHAIVAEQGGMTPEAAVEWVKQFKKDGRYQRDVY